jgi:hypothetical protein
VQSIRQSIKQGTHRYVVILATALAALAVGCADSTAPRQDVCSGGGTQGWDRTCDPGTTAATATHADTTVIVHN